MTQQTIIPTVEHLVNNTTCTKSYYIIRVKNSNTYVKIRYTIISGEDDSKANSLQFSMALVNKRSVATQFNQLGDIQYMIKSIQQRIINSDAFEIIRVRKLTEITVIN